MLPLGADGKTLNLDFETGTLKDWTAEGDAFKDQPIKGDTVSPRRNDMHSRHQGQYWIGGYEKYGDKPQGTLTSVPFKVTHPWASFLVGGGPHPPRPASSWSHCRARTCSFGPRALEEEDMRRVLVDLSEYQGQGDPDPPGRQAFGRLGAHQLRRLPLSRAEAERPGATEDRTAGTRRRLQVRRAGAGRGRAGDDGPDGFKVTLFAGEPDVVQPIAMCVDDRGRLWVAEAFTIRVGTPSPVPSCPTPTRRRGTAS